MLDEGTHCALSQAWWSWDAAVVRRALWASVLGLFRIQAKAAFQRNRIMGRIPQSWAEMESLGRENRTIERVMKGDHNLCLEFLLGGATLLGFNTRDCFPDTKTWISEATAYLSAPKFGGSFPVGVLDARTYADHIVPIVASGPYRTTDALLDRIEMVEHRERLVVRKVASAIGPALFRIAPRISLSAAKG